MKRNLFRSLALATALAGGVSTGALAGECPADQRGRDAQPPGATMPKGVTDTVLAAIDLAREPARLDGRQLRLRRLEIQPGGVVPGTATATGRR